VTLRGAAAAAVVTAGLASFSALPQVTIVPRQKAAPQPDEPKASLRVDTNLVLIPVTVYDPLNRPVTGLEKEHFRVLDDNVEQTITSFGMEDEPLAAGLVFDVSGSMGEKLRLSRKAASEFFRLANPEDEFLLVEFNEAPKVVVPLTSDVDQIRNRLVFSESKGRTALLDAVVLALHELKKSGKNRKALLIISDGGDNSSRYTEAEVKNVVRESDALIYAIGVFGGPATPEELSGPQLLRALAEQSGGRSLEASAGEMPDIAAKIGMELRNRYTLGYIPTDQRRDGRYHPVQVKVVPPRGLPALHASWRRGYFSPSN
jgi:Ca-activated chloride channel homolog